MLYLLFFNFLLGKYSKMKSKLKTLSGLVFKDGPIFNKIQLSLKVWKVAYKKRNLKGDESVIKFLEHFAEFDSNSVVTKE